MDSEKLLIILKRIESCLNHNDWINAKEYILYELNKIKKE